MSLPAPLPEHIGHPRYYRMRHLDHVRRHLDLESPPLPPGYYLSFGEKYAWRFTRHIAPTLSPDGQRWVAATLRDLQQRIEERLCADPAAFARLEADPAAFDRFAFDTHIQAYAAVGITDLPPGDVRRILSAVDPGELLRNPLIVRGIVTISRLVLRRRIAHLVRAQRAAHT